MTSRLPWRECSTTRLPETTGDEWPAPAVASHRLVSWAGHAAGGVNDDATPSRAGPRHCGHDAAGAWR